MGRGGVETWDVQLLKFGPAKLDACQAILNSRYKDAESGDLDSWYYAMVSALELLADNSIECSLATSNHRDVYLSDEVLCSLLNVSDQFGLEHELNRDGSYTYVQVIDPSGTSSDLSNFVRDPEGTSVANATQERAFLEDEWVPNIQALIDFLNEESDTKENTVYLQVVTPD